MNIKDRLKSLKEQNSSLTIKEDNNVSQFFNKDEETEQLIVKSFNNHKNFILLCDKNCNKELVCRYINKFIKSTEKTEFINNITEDLKYSLASKIVVTEPTTKDIINILKLSIEDFKTFVFAMNAKNYEYVLNNLNTLISIELPNLKNENIEYLIGSSEAIVIFFTTNDDGIYYIKNIGEISYQRNNLSLISLSNKKEGNQSEEKITIEDTPIKEETKIETTKEETIIETKPKEIIIPQETTKTTDENKKEKLKKYNLLKEKAKRKKL